MRTELFTEENYREKMNGEVAAWRKEHLQSLRIQSYDGTRISCWYAIHPNARASVVFIHGFTEYTAKYMETLYYFYREGYSVFMADQRGHGRSGRKVPEPERVYIRSFDEYVQDLRCLTDRVIRTKEPAKPLFLFGHSMGGCISALFLEAYPEIFRAAILSSPMLKLTLSNVPDAVVKGLFLFSKIAGWNNRPAPGSAPFPQEPDFENSCATSAARYYYHFEEQKRHKAYQTTSATYAWLRAAVTATEKVRKNAAKAALPVLVCQAGNDTLVDNSGQDEFVRNAPDAALVRFPTAKHEIYRSTEDVLGVYYSTLFRFFERYTF